MPCLPSAPTSAAAHAECPDGVTRGDFVGYWTCTILSVPWVGYFAPSTSDAEKTGTAPSPFSRTMAQPSCLCIGTGRPGCSHQAPGRHRRRMEGAGLADSSPYRPFFTARHPAEISISAARHPDLTVITTRECTLCGVWIMQCPCTVRFLLKSFEKMQERTLR
jgi:hypothetical protein